jgi:hypothetical protein
MIAADILWPAPAKPARLPQEARVITRLCGPEIGAESMVAAAPRADATRPKETAPRHGA